MVDFSKLLARPRASTRVHVYRCKLCGAVEEYDIELPMRMRKHLVLFGAKCGALTTYVRVDFDPDDEERYRRELRAMTLEQRLTAGLCVSFFDETDRWCPNAADTSGACETCRSAAFAQGVMD